MNQIRNTPIKLVLVISVLTLVVLAGGAVLRAESPIPRLYLPVAINGKQAIPRVDSIFGVQMYNDSRPTSRFYDSLVDSRASWLRIAINWHVIEPVNVPPADYTWTAADNTLSAARQDTANLHVIGTFETAPAWAVTDPNRLDGPLTPLGLTEFVEFVGATVERFDGDGFQDAPGSPVVEQWEFYNEPDRSYLVTDGRWGESGDQYAELLRQVYPVVKAANPSAQVVFGGIAYDWFIEDGGPFVRSFLDDVINAGGAAYFDVFNFHTYPVFAANWTPANSPHSVGLLEKAKYLRDRLASLGVDKPMIVTEAGWHSNDIPNLPPGSQTIQAAYVVQLFTQSFAADLDSMIWWMLYDPGGGYENGLVTDDPTPVSKLSFTVYQTMVDLMREATFVRVLSPVELGDPAQEAYVFTRQGQVFYVAWLNPVTTTEKHPLSLQAKSVIVRDMVGQVTAVVNDQDDGSLDNKVTVMVGGMPEYIEVTQ